MSDFGEPWHSAEHDGQFWIVSNARDQKAGPFEGYPPMHRAIACVNALAGIPDPERFVLEAKAFEVLERKAKADGRRLIPGIRD